MSISRTKTTECPFYSGSKDNRYYSDAGQALYWASCNGDESRVIRLLAVPGVQVNWRSVSVTNDTPLHTAVSPAELAHYITNITPLHTAAWNGHIRIVQLLLQNAADVNIKTDDGYTAADVARRMGRTAVSELLQQVSSEDTTTTRSTTPSTSKSHARVDDETRKLLL